MKISLYYYCIYFIDYNPSCDLPKTTLKNTNKESYIVEETNYDNYNVQTNDEYSHIYVLHDYL